MPHYFIENTIGEDGEYINPHPQAEEILELYNKPGLSKSRRTYQFINTLLEYAYFVTNEDGLNFIKKNIPHLQFKYQEITDKDEEEEGRYSGSLYVKPDKE